MTHFLYKAVVSGSLLFSYSALAHSHFPEGAQNKAPEQNVNQEEITGEHAEESAFVPVCDRTIQVQRAIMSKFAVSECSTVTKESLSRIPSLFLRGRLWADNGQITELKPGDFSGLSHLLELRLDMNHLRSLPEGVFAGLSLLAVLDLSGNHLRHLPEGIFADVDILEELYLGYNQLNNLPEGIFSSLSSLERLHLNDNQLRRLPYRIFADLSSLKTLSIEGNQLSSLPAGMFANLSFLNQIAFADNNFSFFERRKIKSFLKSQEETMELSFPYNKARYVY